MIRPLQGHLFQWLTIPVIGLRFDPRSEKDRGRSSKGCEAERLRQPWLPTEDSSLGGSRRRNATYVYICKLLSGRGAVLELISLR